MRKRMMSGSVLAVLATIVCILAGSATARTLAAPTLTGFAPSHGPIGEKVMIYGHDLAGVTSVQFNGTQAVQFSVDSTGTHLTAYVPPETLTGPGLIIVITPGGTVTSSAKFTVNPPSGVLKAQRPRITTFTPVKGRIGTRVTIRGAYLGGALWVKFGGVKVPFTVPSANKIVAVVSRNAHSGKIVVRTSGGLATKLTQFTVLSGAGV
jgi:hypothetical protein